MVNSKLYDDYEGEGQIILSDEKKNELVIWEGYIYVLMESMFNQGYRLLADFYSRKNNNPWMIPDINNAITQFKSFNLSNIEQEGITERFPELIHEITGLLIEALKSNQNVYIYEN